MSIKILNINKSNVLVEIMKIKKINKEFLIVDTPQKETLLLKDTQLIPINTKLKDGKINFYGPKNKLKSFKLATFQNGILINKAKSKDITSNFKIELGYLTPKQIELENKLGSFLEENFRIINQSKLRMKNKSHCFLRYANALPRDRNKSCIFCPNIKESTNHILYECNKFRSLSKKILNIINNTFKLNIIFNDEYLVILNKDNRINIFQIINQRITWNLRCTMIHEGDTFSDTKWENMIQMEIERFIMKEIFLSNQLEETIKLWKPLIKEFDGETKMVSLIKIFEQ